MRLLVLVGLRIGWVLDIRGAASAVTGAVHIAIKVRVASAGMVLQVIQRRRRGGAGKTVCVGMSIGHHWSDRTASTGAVSSVRNTV